MLPNLTKWKIYHNGTQVFEIEGMGIPTDRLKGSFYFDVLKSEANSISVGTAIDLVMPPGTPVFHCRVTGIVENPDDNQKVQIKAAAIESDTSGISGQK